MFPDLCNRSMAYFSSHPIHNSIAHAAGGFGLAILLQYYLLGDVFINYLFGWGLVILCVGMHIRSCMK